MNNVAILLAFSLFLFVACQKPAGSDQQETVTEPSKEATTIQGTPIPSVSSPEESVSREPGPSYEQIQKDTERYFQALSSKDGKECDQITQGDLKERCKKQLAESK